jgi:hypothetical protein
MTTESEALKPCRVLEMRFERWDVSLYIIYGILTGGGGGGVDGLTDRLTDLLTDGLTD